MSLAQLQELLSINSTSDQRLSVGDLLREPERAAASFVLTKEAEGSLARVLSALRRGRPGVFWISGDRGSGKTHFLGYLNSILRHPDFAPDGFREDVPDVQMMSVEVEVKDGAQLAQAVAGPLCEKLKVPRHLADLWRRLGAEVGLRATLEEVGRSGFKRTLITIDDCGERGLDPERWRMLADLAASTRGFKSPAFFMVATQGEAPESIAQLPVGPKGAREITALTLAALRNFSPASEPLLKSYFDLYAAANPTLLDIAEFQSIFPFHERTIEVLDAISRDSRRSGVIGEIIKETLTSNGSE